jgi:hypothetical protein
LQFLLKRVFRLLFLERFSICASHDELEMNVWFTDCRQSRANIDAVRRGRGAGGPAPQSPACSKTIALTAPNDRSEATSLWNAAKRERFRAA